MYNLPLTCVTLLKGTYVYYSLEWWVMSELVKLQVHGINWSYAQIIFLARLCQAGDLNKDGTIIRWS
jgi:hypothetical protein